MIPKWKHTITLDWAKGPWSASLTNNFFAGYEDYDTSTHEEVNNYTTFDASVPSYRARIDQEKALSYGVSISDLNTTLSNTLGSGFVNYFTYQNRNFQVYMQNEDTFRQTPDDLNKIFVRGGDGERIPISEFVTLERQSAPSVVTRFGVYPSAQFQGGPAPGYSSGQAIAAMQAMNASVRNMVFAPAFFGTPAVMLLTGLVALRAGEKHAGERDDERRGKNKLCRIGMRRLLERKDASLPTTQDDVESILPAVKRKGPAHAAGPVSECQRPQ